MSTFVYSTQLNLDGPWLLARTDLLHLGRIIDAISNKFLEASEERIDGELSKMLERYPSDSREVYRDECRNSLAQKFEVKSMVTLSLSNSRYVEANTIEQLLSLPELLDELPIGFKTEIASYHRSVKIKLEKGFFGGAAKLSIRTSPETDELAREAFVELQNWADTNQAPLWQRLWVNNYGLIVWFWICALFTAVAIIPSTTDSIHKEIRPAAIQLLKNGISNENVPKAIELLLRNEFAEPVVEHKNQAPTWFAFLLIGGLVTVIILWFRPSLEIGIGRSAARLKRWRVWINFVGISLPSFILVSVLWPYFAELMGFPH